MKHPRARKQKPFDPKPAWLRWKAQPWDTALLPEQLDYIAREMLSGDPLSVLGITHAGSPDRVDQNGETKAAYRDLIGDVSAFQPLADLLSNPTGKMAWLASTRTSLKQKAKVRNIDTPSEKKRLAQQARMLLSLIPLVYERDALDPGVVGFRNRREFEQFAKREDGITIQDVFAVSLMTLIREHGPFVLLVDLHDAYGNLPHKAIKVALKELLGLTGPQAREVVELARVRTRLGDGRLHKPKEYGIEQGAPIAPLLFNLVQTVIARRLRKQGYESGCFGDDIGIAANTVAEAKTAFTVYRGILDDLGFDVEKALRDLDDKAEKASRIYDARCEPVPLIKTYMVTTREIGLTTDKACELLSRLPPDASLNEARRRNKWKAVTKAYLRRLLRDFREGPTASARLRAEGVMVMGDVLAQPPNLNVPARAQARPDDPDPPASAEGDGDPEGVPSKKAPCSPGESSYRGTRSTAMPLGNGDSSCLQAEEVEGCDSLSPYPESASAESPELERQLGAGETANDRPSAGRPHDGRVTTPRGGPDAGCPTSGDEGEAAGHQASPSPSVSIIPLKVEHLLNLTEGRRLRAGDNYRPGAHSKKGTARQRVFVDLREAGPLPPAWRMPWAVKQLVRATSAAGRSEFLVHPAGPWHSAFTDLDGDGYRVSTRESADGIVVTVWPRATGERGHKVAEPPPAADLVVTLHRTPDDVRCWLVELVSRDAVDREVVTVRSRNPLIGKIEVVAHVVEDRQLATLAVRDTGGIRRLLQHEVRARQVDLWKALQVLKAWEPSQVSPNWMLLSRRRSRPRPTRSRCASSQDPGSRR